MDKKEAKERDQDVVGWVFIYSILSCTVTLPYPLFPTIYLKKLVENITIKKIIIMMWKVLERSTKSV